VDELAGGDVTKWDLIFDMKAIEFLNLLSYKYAKRKWEMLNKNS